jgi:hypothetical protein
LAEALNKTEEIKGILFSDFRKLFSKESLEYFPKDYQALKKYRNQNEVEDCKIDEKQ